MNGEIMSNNGGSGYKNGIRDLRKSGPLRSPYTFTDPGRKGISVIVGAEQFDPFYLGQAARAFRNGANLYVVDNGGSRLPLAARGGAIILTFSDERAEELGAEYVPSDIVKHVNRREGNRGE